MNATRRVLRYLYHNTRHMPLAHNKFNIANLRVVIYTDSSWADDEDAKATKREIKNTQDNKKARQQESMRKTEQERERENKTAKKYV